MRHRRSSRELPRFALGRGGPRSGPAGALLVIAVAASSLLPGASAVSPVPPAALRAPFPGSTPTVSYVGTGGLVPTASTTNCSGASWLASFPSPPTANTSSGAVRMDLNVSATGRVSGSSTCDAFAEDQASVGFWGPPIAVRATGNHSVVYTWTVRWNATGAGGSINTRVPSIDLVVEANLFDNTTGRWVVGGASPTDVDHVVLAVRCLYAPLAKGGGCSGFTTSGTATVNLTVSSVLNRTDEYLAFSVVTADLLVAQSNFGCVAQFDLSSHGNGARLERIDVR